VLPHTSDVIALGVTVFVLVSLGIVVAVVWLWTHGLGMDPATETTDDMELLRNEGPEPISAV
jgi:hypothetical protein